MGKNFKIVKKRITRESQFSAPISMDGNESGLNWTHTNLLLFRVGFSSGLDGFQNSDSVRFRVDLGFGCTCVPRAFFFSPLIFKSFMQKRKKKQKKNAWFLSINILFYS